MARKPVVYGEVRQRLQAEIEGIHNAGHWKDERAAHEPAHLEQAVAAFVEVGRTHHVI